MKNFFFIYAIVIFLMIISCKTVSKKVDAAASEEEKKLSRFLNKSTDELKIEFGKPDFIEVANSKNKIFIYYDSKFKIKCERRFEIQNSKVVGYSSKNCW
ncbi:MAG TPA: hypothetical protein QF658_00415 [Pelagibacteraceae bacterium]|nr:hypothetical protein [Pelagibacteraceae bacterium]